MIVGFKHRGLKRLFEKGDARLIAPEHGQKVVGILTAMNTAKRIEDLDIATFRLHQLSGNRKETWSITIRANWRITFTFKDSEADHVNYEDYH